MVKYNEIWSKIKILIGRKTFDCDPMFRIKYLKMRIKSYNHNAAKHFHVKVPKARLKWIGQPAIVIGFVSKLSINYYPQTFLEE